MQILNVLIACEESQAECEAFRALGHNAYSCDIQQCRPKGHPEWHIHEDVRPYLHGKADFVTQDGQYHNVKQWHLIVAHPPCTYLCKLSSFHIWHPVTGYAWFNGKFVECNKERVAAMEKARQFFVECLNANAPYVAVENPIPMKAARLPKPNAFACPSWYGVKYTKKTCYWLKNLPPLFAGVENPHTKCFVVSSRGKYRSRTFKPLAEALAKQWSDFILKDLKLTLMSELLQYRYDVLASLYWIPCTLQDLAQRDFCKNLPTWYIDEILLKLESLGLVVKRKDGVYKAVKGKAKKVLNQRGYEIDD